ncbi:MAG: right-handed parallel beta-helix repeat-containing protein [Saprospiraceae bacterium]|nr:right-handed parallel beta-helix repeat-containing protein [Saprospiraceae bacterium]
MTATGHTISARGIVIWNGFKENITISNCHVYNNNCCGIELQDGTASGVTMTGNNIHDNWDNGIGLLSLNGNTGSNAITNNTLTNNGRFGIELKLPDGNGSNISVAGNTIQWTSSFVASRPSEKRDLAGIAAFRREPMEQAMWIFLQV